MLRRAPIALLSALMLPACASRDAVRVAYRSDGDHAFSSEERQVIESIAEATVREVKGLLPLLPLPITIVVNDGRQVIEETGETGSAVPPSKIYWTVDSTHPGGVKGVATKELRASLFHELHHLVRSAKIEDATIIDRAITEGMATAFERDYGGARPPWGQYPPDEVREWAKEVAALPITADRAPWMHRHPDGRRWIAYKVGTYLVDRAARASEKSSSEMIALTTDEVMALATAKATLAP
jgi:uncharacterized protein YjaZ